MRIGMAPAALDSWNSLILFFGLVTLDNALVKVAADVTAPVLADLSLHLLRHLSGLLSGTLNRAVPSPGG